VNDQLTEQDIREIAERLRVIDTVATSLLTDASFYDDHSVLEFLQETLAYAEQALQEVRRLREQRERIAAWVAGISQMVEDDFREAFPEVTVLAREDT
jgi:cell division septum initiation protein DivIVA